MCGIVAYVGRKIAQPVLIEGLKRLEYRGYDSAGVAVVDSKGDLHIRRAVGRISVLESAISTTQPLPGASLGMAHTRWATHGAPPRSTPTRTPTTASRSRWFTTASSKTIPSSRNS